MEHVETVIIGGGQAGLSVGYYLQQQGHHFVILDAHARIGDAWRKRWDSLRLFTPATAASPGCLFQHRAIRSRPKMRWPTTWRPTRRASSYR